MTERPVHISHRWTLLGTRSLDYERLFPFFPTTYQFFLRNVHIRSNFAVCSNSRASIICFYSAVPPLARTHPNTNGSFIWTHTMIILMYSAVSPLARGRRVSLPNQHSTQLPSCLPSKSTRCFTTGTTPCTTATTPCTTDTTPCAPCVLLLDTHPPPPSALLSLPVPLMSTRCFPITPCTPNSPFAAPNAA